jgi:hypothetical protein
MAIIADDPDRQATEMDRVDSYPLSCFIEALRQCDIAVSLAERFDPIGDANAVAALKGAHERLADAFAQVRDRMAGTRHAVFIATLVWPPTLPGDAQADTGATQ